MRQHQIRGAIILSCQTLQTVLDFDIAEAERLVPEPVHEPAADVLPIVDPNHFDRVVVALSGGKDSIACLLHLLDLGTDPAKIEIWHHDIDGHESNDHFMDWPFVRDYVMKIGEAFGIPVYFSWREGGFLREMLRENSLTAPVRFETPEGTIGQAGGIRGKLSTRRRYPQVSPDLSVRWCSAALKIDVCSTAINNQDRFLGKKTLLVTGERAQESANRARYATFERHKSDNRDGKKVVRHVDQWRPIHAWTNEQVWEIIERYRVRPAPPYYIGFGRLSCASCIFGSENQWATLLAIDEPRIRRIAAYEQEFGVTIHRKLLVLQRAERGQCYPAASANPAMVKAALAEEYPFSVIVPDHEPWILPAGAYGENCGPC